MEKEGERETEIETEERGRGIPIFVFSLSDPKEHILRTDQNCNEKWEKGTMRAAGKREHREKHGICSLCRMPVEKSNMKGRKRNGKMEKDEVPQTEKKRKRQNVLIPVSSIYCFFFSASPRFSPSFLIFVIRLSREKRGTQAST